MTSTTKSKPVYNTVAVTLDNGSVVHVKRVAMKDMDTLLSLQESLMIKYVEVDGAIGKIIADADFRSQLESLCSILPLVEKTKTGEDKYLEFSSIEDNWEQLILLFLNGGLNPSTRRNDSPFTPSLISDLHFLPYIEIMKKTIQDLEKTREAED